MDSVEVLVLGLALAGGAFVVVEALAKEPGALLSLLRDPEALLKKPAPATPPSAPRLRLGLAGAMAGAAAVAAVAATLVPEETPDVLLSAAGTASRIAAGTTHGPR